MAFSKYSFLKLNASNWTELMENLLPIFFLGFDLLVQEIMSFSPG